MPGIWKWLMYTFWGRVEGLKKCGFRTLENGWQLWMTLKSTVLYMEVTCCWLRVFCRQLFIEKGSIYADLTIWWVHFWLSTRYMYKHHKNIKVCLNYGCTCVNANCLKHRAIKEVNAIEVTSQLHVFKMVMAIKLINLQFKIK